MNKNITVIQHKAARVITSKKENTNSHNLICRAMGNYYLNNLYASSESIYRPSTDIYIDKWQVEFLDGAPPGSIGGCSDSRWVIEHLFFKWFEHFNSIGMPTKKEPEVLILNGYYSPT